VELSRSGPGQWTLVSHARAPLPGGAVEDGQIERLDVVAHVVRDLVQRARVRSRRVAMALPTKNVILRKVRLRSDMSDEELAVHVEAEAATFVPFPVEELALDFSVVGPAAGSDTEVDVLIAAARRDRVQDRLALAEAAGLEPIVVETESNASQLALREWQRRRGQVQSDETTALVELGHESTNLKVVAGQEILFEREQAWGARHLIGRVMREFGLNEEQARVGQIEGKLPIGYDVELVPEHCSATAREVDRMLQFFYAFSSGASGRRLSGVVLAGGAASLKGMANQVADATGLPVTVIDPFEHMQLGPGADRKALAGHSAAYLQACGLALRSFES
jgi:type IV pilus assembly protein PilM